jgi:adenylate cyclase
LVCPLAAGSGAAAGRGHRAVAKPALPLPDKPSIAVLPFENLSGDPKQERLAGGLTEDLITDLSRFRELFVIARNSTEVYKSKPVDVRQVARELGGQYVLEGSLQVDGDQVRVTAQLIDAMTGNHVWSERYDRPLDDVFAVQDEVTQKIAGTLGGW